MKLSFKFSIDEVNTKPKASLTEDFANTFQLKGLSFEAEKEYTPEEFNGMMEQYAPILGSLLCDLMEEATGKRPERLHPMHPEDRFEEGGMKR